MQIRRFIPFLKSTPKNDRPLPQPAAPDGVESPRTKPTNKPPSPAAPVLAAPAAPAAPAPASVGTPAVVRLLSFLEPVQIGVDTLLSELGMRYGLNMEIAEKDQGVLKQCVLGLHLDAELAPVLAREGTEAELLAAAAFFEDTEHEALAEKLADLAPMLRTMLAMPPQATDKKKGKVSDNGMELLKLLLPDCLPLPDTAPVEMLVRVIKESPVAR